MTTFTVYSQDADVSEENPDADYRLGMQYSRRCTWATGDSERPYLTLTSTAFTTGRVVTASGEIIRDAESDDEALPVLAGVDEKEYPKDQEYLELFESCEDWWDWHSAPDEVSDELGSDILNDDIGYVYQSSLTASNEFCRSHISGADYFANYSPEYA